MSRQEVGERTRNNENEGTCDLRQDYHLLSVTRQPSICSLVSNRAETPTMTGVVVT